MKSDFSHFKEGCQLSWKSNRLKPGAHWFESSTAHLEEFAEKKTVLTSLKNKQHLLGYRALSDILGDNLKIRTEFVAETTR